MASHLSSLGFDVRCKQDFAELFELAYLRGQKHKVKDGTYAVWNVDDYIQIYGQIDKKDVPIGINPHFYGQSRQIVKLVKKNNTSNDTILDGGFQCWAGADDGEQEGIFPFIFDCPRANRYKYIKLPQCVEVQIMGIAHEIDVYDNDEEFEKGQESDIKFASESFIPSGMFNADNTPKKDLEAMAIMSGHVIKTEQLKNAHSSLSYRYIVVEVLGCRFDVIVDGSLLNRKPIVGGVISGVFWLSGIITGDFEEKTSVIRRLFG